MFGDRSDILDELRLPPTQIVASTLTQGVVDPSGPAQCAGEELLGKATQQVAGVATRVGFQEEEGPPLDHERATTEPTDRTAKESLETFPGVPPHRSISKPSRQASDPPGRSFLRGELPTHGAENLRPVGPTDHEAEEPPDLVVGQAYPTPDVIAIGPDLALYDITETEAPRDRLCGILVLEDLHGQIHVPHDLEESECHDGLDATGACFSRRRGRGIRHSLEIGRGHLTR